MLQQDSSWLILSASSGSSAATEISGLTEITKSVIVPLANNDVSIFSLSTYQTDYVLVRKIYIHSLYDFKLVVTSMQSSRRCACVSVNFFAKYMLCSEVTFSQSGIKFQHLME